MENRVSKILNIEKPIIQGPMNGLTNANFVASVSEAGGLGILGPNAGEARITNSPFETAEKMRLEVKKVKKLTSKPFASTIMVSEDLSYTSYLIDMLIEENISAVLINGILDQTIFNKLKENNIKIIFRPLTPTIENAIKSEELGADFFLLQVLMKAVQFQKKLSVLFRLFP